MSTKKGVKAVNSQIPSRKDIMSDNTSKIVTQTTATSTSSKKAKVPTGPPSVEYKNYRSLLVQLDQGEVISIDGQGSNQIYLYFEHKLQDAATVADEELSEDAEEELDVKRRTIHVYGVPIFFTPTEVQECFETFGSVESAFPTTRRAIFGSQQFSVVMEDEESIQRAMEAKDALVHISMSSSPSAVGMGKWRTEYANMRPDYSKLQTQVDLFLSAFDKRTAAEKAAANKPVVDEEGWTLVVGSKRKGGADSAKSAIKQAAKDYARKVQKQAGHAFAFYKFQEKERKQERLALLRRKFEEDKKKIQDMRSNRKFKPF